MTFFHGIDSSALFCALKITPVRKKQGAKTAPKTKRNKALP